MNLVRMALDAPALLRFGKNQALLPALGDDLGYLLHAWLAASFGRLAPKPFWFDERQTVLWGYAQADAVQLLEYLHDFSDPGAYAVLRADTLQSKPMPERWQKGKRVLLHVRLCPVSRRDGTEKDVFLRALDAWDACGGERCDPKKPTRAATYRAWFVKQVSPQAVTLEQVSVVGMRARLAMLRPARDKTAKARRRIERPEVHIEAIARIADGTAFAQMLARGIGRHRAFGFGMIRVLPAP